MHRCFSLSTAETRRTASLALGVPYWSGLHISAPRTSDFVARTRAAVPAKRLNQRQSDCNHSPITNNRKTSKGEIKCQIKKIATHNRAIRRSPLLRSRNQSEERRVG